MKDVIESATQELVHWVLYENPEKIAPLLAAGADPLLPVTSPHYRHKICALEIAMHGMFDRSCMDDTKIREYGSMAILLLQATDKRVPETIAKLADPKLTLPKDDPHLISGAQQHKYEPHYLIAEMIWEQVRQVLKAQQCRTMLTEHVSEHGEIAFPATPPQWEEGEIKWPDKTPTLTQANYLLNQMIVMQLNDWVQYHQTLTNTKLWHDNSDALAYALLVQQKATHQGLEPWRENGVKRNIVIPSQLYHRLDPAQENTHLARYLAEPAGEKERGA